MRRGIACAIGSCSLRISYSLQTLYKSYLIRRDGAVVERPQFLYMRVAVALHGKDLPRVLQTYELLSSRAYTHATPTLYNAGTTSQYLASCFLYQPPVGGPISVMGSCVTDVSALWTVDGGVGMSLGAVPARECVPEYVVDTIATHPSQHQRSPPLLGARSASGGPQRARPRTFSEQMASPFIGDGVSARLARGCPAVLDIVHASVFCVFRFEARFPCALDSRHLVSLYTSAV